MGIDESIATRLDRQNRFRLTTAAVSTDGSDPIERLFVKPSPPPSYACIEDEETSAGAKHQKLFLHPVSLHHGIPEKKTGPANDCR